MKIKNNQVKPLFELLVELPLRGKQARMRGKLIKKLAQHQNEYISVELQKLKLEHAVKDDEGNIKYVNEEKTEFEISKEFLIDETELLNEEFIIELNESNKDMLLTIADILLEGDFDIKGLVVYYYDDWCEEMERIIFKYENQQ